MRIEELHILDLVLPRVQLEQVIKVEDFRYVADVVLAKV
jgi:hypothetical protein